MMNSAATQIDSLVTQIAKSLVNSPEDVLVNTLEGANTIVMELRVAKSDVGKIIGKQGRTAEAMRYLIGAISSKTKKRMILEIID
jgi:uncharacterized protein